MAAKEFDSEVKVSIMISGPNHCGDHCPFLVVEEDDTDVFATPRGSAFCNVYNSVQLMLDTRRKNFPWKRCAACKENDCSGEKRK
jgi:hypothetical protein